MTIINGEAHPGLCASLVLLESIQWKTSFFDFLHTDSCFSEDSLLVARESWQGQAASGRTELPSSRAAGVSVRVGQCRGLSQLPDHLRVF